MTTRDVRWRRRERTLLLGLPAILALIVCIAAAIAWRILCTRDELAARYEQRAAQAMADEQFDLAALAYARLMELAPQNPAGSFGLAQALAKGGEDERAAALLAEIAPRDSTGHLPAHRLLARRLMQEQPLSAAAASEAEGHLARVLEKLPEDPEAHALLGRLYASLGRLLEAVRHLAQASPHSPAARVQLARVHAALGNRQTSHDEALQAARVLRTISEANPDNEAARLLWADALALGGDYEAAENVLRTGLTLRPKGPYAEALVMLLLRWAEDLVRQPSYQPEQVQAVLERGTVMADGIAEASPQLHALLARIHTLLGQPSEAQQHFAAAIETRPELGLDLARLHARRGDRDAARVQAAATLDLFRARLENDPRDEAARLVAADAALLCEDYATAVAFLEAGLQHSARDIYRTGLARAYLAWWDAQLNAGALDNSPDPFELLRPVLEHDPNSLEVIQRLVSLGVRQDSLGAHSRRWKQELLQAMLAQGKNSAAAHLILGSEALDQGNADLARNHLQRAYELAPGMVEVMNNLAWALAHSEQSDLPRALTIIDDAIARRPKDLNLRDTRGRILVKLERWPEALNDLETCLPLMRGQPEFHAALAETYEHLGMTSLAEEHRKLVGAKNRPQ